MRKVWGIDNDFCNCSSNKDPLSQVKIIFCDREYEGAVTVAKHGRETSPAYRLWFTDELSFELKNTFIMSFVRDIENRLRLSKSSEVIDIEDDIPFWEFLDIEYDCEKRTFFFTAHYTQKPVFSGLFMRFVDSSPVLHKIDDELAEKPPFRIYPTKWKKREELELELRPRNVLYYLIDTKNKLLYIGEGGSLIDRLQQNHPSIPQWDYFRYCILPDEIAPHRKTFERMLIRDFASLLTNKIEMESIKISEYRLANDRIDAR